MQKKPLSPIQMSLPLDCHPKVKLDEQRRPVLVSLLSDLLLTAAPGASSPAGEVHDETR